MGDVQFFVHCNGVCTNTYSMVGFERRGAREAMIYKCLTIRLLWDETLKRQLGMYSTTNLSKAHPRRGGEQNG